MCVPFSDTPKLVLVARHFGTSAGKGTCSSGALQTGARHRHAVSRAVTQLAMPGWRWPPLWSRRTRRAAAFCKPTAAAAGAHPAGAGAANGEALRSQPTTSQALPRAARQPVAASASAARDPTRALASECRACCCSNALHRRLWRHAAAGVPCRRGRRQHGCRQRGSGVLAARARAAAPHSYGQSMTTSSTASWRHQVGGGGALAAPWAALSRSPALASPLAHQASVLADRWLPCVTNATMPVRHTWSRCCSMRAEEGAVASSVQAWLNPPAEELPDDFEMPIWDHLDELRERVGACGAWRAGGSGRACPH